MCRKLDALIESCPLIVMPFKEPTDLDSENPQADSLPAPMAPLVNKLILFYALYWEGNVLSERVKLHRED